MKTSIFDMNFTLPPMVEMTQVENDMDYEIIPLRRTVTLPLA